MANNERVAGRVKALVAELLAYEAEEESDGRAENINDIEDAMVRIGDQVAREVGVQKLACHTSQAPERPPCPRCGHSGEQVGQRTRHVISRRGQVPVTEAKYHCPKCRRLFFPSDRRVGA